MVIDGNKNIVLKRSPLKAIQLTRGPGDLELRLLNADIAICVVKNKNNIWSY